MPPANPRMTPKVNLVWKGVEVMYRLKAFDATVVSKIVFWTEAECKRNIVKPFPHKDGANRGQVDTGAMLNSVQGIVAGQTANQLPSGIAGAVVVGVQYAPYQESIRPFLYPAGEAAAKMIGPMVGDVMAIQGIR